MKQPRKLLLAAAAGALLAAPPLARQITTLPYFEDFEASNGGYTTAGANSTWAWGVPSDGFITGAGDGARAWVTNLTGSYSNGENSYIESPAFDFTGLALDPTLQFLHIFTTESCCDETFVEVSLNGGPFQKLGMGGDLGSINWYNDTANDWWDGSSGPAGEWRLARHTVTGGAGNMARFRWRFSSDSSVTSDGVGVDAVSVIEGLTDVGVQSLDSPSSGGFLSATEVVSVSLINLGTGAVMGFPLSYTVSGPVPAMVTENFTGAIEPGMAASFSFSTPADFTVPGTYTVTVTAELMGDEMPANDSVTAQILSPATITSFPYFEDFETDAGMYVTDGDLSTWEHGFPAANFITGAASGQRAWVTGLTTDYNNFEDSYLQSPPFDLTGMTSDPFLQFQHIYQIDFSDESWVEVSTNGGPFIKLGSAGDPGSINWYNDSSGNWWDNTSGSVGQWRTARHLLTGAAGNTVQLRWRLVGGSFVNEDGVGVDAVEIFEAPFGIGQPPQPNLAMLDVNAAKDVLGFPVSSAAVVPGPFFAVVASDETLDLHFEGSPNQPIVLAGGALQVGAASLPPFGQLDLASGFVILVSGLDPGFGLGSLFVTNFSGFMDFSTTVPLGLVGESIAFQAAILNSTGGVPLTNAVLTTFVP